MLNTFNIKKFLSLLAVLFCFSLILTQNIYSQGRDRSKYFTFGDTSLISIDTSLITDTTRIKVVIDSTARLKYFKYVRPDEPVPLFGFFKHPFVIWGSSRVEHKNIFDSLNYVQIVESINNSPIKYPLEIEMETYIDKLTRLQTRELFYKLVSETYKIETQDDLEKLFKNITDITIPLPFKTETIFGPPTINLKINGLIDITGSYQNTKTDQTTLLLSEQSQNNINFKQEVQVTTKGKIGDKLTIDADWNSQRTFEFENQLKLKYTGYPDEVIQKIEAGNVSLETKSNLIGSTQALFGIKGVFKLGPLTLTTIVSQKKSEKKEVNLTGGSQEVTFNIAAWDYSEKHYFLDTLYRSKFGEFYAKGFVSDGTYDVSDDIEVWVQAETNNPNKRRAVCWVQLEPEPSTGYDQTITNYETQIPGKKMVGYFYKLGPGDYTLNSEAGYITLNINTPSAPKDAIAVSYRLSNNPSIKYGTFSNEAPTDSLVLKIVKINSLQSPAIDTNYTAAWNLKIRSIYELPVKNIKSDPSKLNFYIYYKPPSGEIQKNYNNLSYLRLLRLDLRQNGGTYDTTFGINPDGLFDFFPNLTVNLSNGEIIFPTLSPFFQTLKDGGVPDSLVAIDSLIYSGTKEQARNSTIKYYLGGTAIGDASDRYQLGFNLVEGSVHVFIGTQELAAGIDFTIDYTTGELLVLNREALAAGSNLKIVYETNDLFQLASKTLLGTRAEFQINKTSYLGFTFLNLKQQTLNDKVRIGEEPTNNSIFSFDGATEIKTNFLTKLVNKIPGYHTKEESSLSLKGEIAFMLPEPNTKRSKIPSDNNEPIAYIDDFEGSKKIIPLGTNPLGWIVSSIPDSSGFNMNDSLIGIRRCKLEWFNLENSVPLNEVFPNKQVGSSTNKSLTPLIFSIKPNKPGMFTYLDSTAFVNNEPNPLNRWTGVFKYLNTSMTNLVDENIGFIEIWMQVNNNVQLNDSAKMIIDLGSISEKIITASSVPYAQNRNFHTEDLNDNGTLDEGEDVGLDGIASRPPFPPSLQTEQDIFPNLGGDPSGDDYNWMQGSADYTGFNGTEGNSQLSEARRIDTEDLSGDGTLNTANNYYEYVVPLTADTLTNPFIFGKGTNGWYQYLIPLNEYSRIFGNASLTNVQYARVWFKGFNQDAIIKIVDINLVGNQWQKQNKSDTSYSVSVVSIEENSNIYQSPVASDILRQKDQSQTDPNVLLNEQSLSLDVRDLAQGQGKFVIKYFNMRPIDLLNYKILKLFVNGDPSFRYIDTSNYDAAIVVRLGSDSSNFYEYKAPIHPDVRPGSPWDPLNEVTITLSDLTSIKQSRDSSNTLYYQDVPNGPPGSKYAVIGNPTISSITQISLGVQNNRGSIYIEPITGSVWFDELRVLKTNDQSGYAYTLSANLKVADLANFNFGYTRTDPNFHSLENRFGSRVLANSWELSTTFNLHKLLNSILASAVSLNFKDFFYIPISFTHSEVYDQPTFVPLTDINLETAVQSKYYEVLNETGDPTFANYKANQVRISSQTLRIQNLFSINGFKFTFPGDNFFTKEILNKIEVSYYRNSTTERSPTSENKYSWDMGGQIGMRSSLPVMDYLNFKVGKFLNLGSEYENAKIYFFFPFIPIMPLYTNNISMGLNFSRSRGDEQLRNQSQPNPTSRNFGANRNFSLDWKFIENWIVDIGGSYSFSAGSDLTYLETTQDTLKQQRTTGEIMDDIFFGGDKFINFGRDLSYQQTVSVNPRFNIPVLKNYIDFTASYSGTYNWRPAQQSTNLGNAVQNRGDFQGTAFLKLKQIFDLFKSTGTKYESGSNSQDDDKQSLANLIKFLGTFVPDQISLTYSHSKNNANGGITGRAGFTNFWIFYGSKDEYGPSRLYQLGWSDHPGKRVPNIALSDLNNFTNTINLSTFINPIFPNNLKITFTYKTSWSKSRSSNYLTDNFGELSVMTSTLHNSTTSRPTFLISGNIIPDLAKPNATASENAKIISESFDNDIVSIPFPNWSLTLSGMEKFDMFSNFVQTMSFQNAFTSEYKKNYKYDGINPEYISNQSITSGFTPLIGIDITFKSLAEGLFTTTFKLNKTKNYDLTPSDQKINYTSTSDLSINASYSKQGFNIPLFGLSLQNDLTISFSYSRTKNDPRLLKYELGIWSDNALNGSISTTINPSIQYALSKSVTIQLFYKYIKTEATEGSLQIPTRTNNEAGLNLRLSIQ